MDEYNHELCVEKHNMIEKAFQYFKAEFEKFNGRMEKVENRFLAIMTILVVNLLGIIGTLGVLLLK